MVNIVVAIKPEPEGPVSVSRRTGRPVYDETSATISIVSRKAIGAALELAKFEPNSQVTAVTVGAGEMGESVLREAVAMGAHQAIHIRHPVLEESDGLGVARAIAAAVQKLDDVRLVITGARTRDRYAGQVGPQVAALCGWPVLSHVREAKLGREGLKVERNVADGSRLVLKLPLPAVLTVSEHFPGLPWATGWGVTAAYKQDIQVWGLEELGLREDVVGPAATVTVVQKIEKAESRERRNEVIDGDPEDAAALLARRLQARGLVR